MVLKGVKEQEALSERGDPLRQEGMKMLELICEIRKQVQAAKTRSKSGRCKFNEDQKIRILIFCEDMLDRGFQEHDAAEILGMHVSTIQGWRKKERARTEENLREGEIFLIRRVMAS